MPALRGKLRRRDGFAFGFNFGGGLERPAFAEGELVLDAALLAGFDGVLPLSSWAMRKEERTRAGKKNRYRQTLGSGHDAPWGMRCVMGIEADGEILPQNG